MHARAGAQGGRCGAHLVVSQQVGVPADGAGELHIRRQAQRRVRGARLHRRDTAGHAVAHSDGPADACAAARPPSSHTHPRTT